MLGRPSKASGALTNAAGPQEQPADADPHIAYWLELQELVGDNLLALAVASKQVACVEAVARAVAEQKFSRFSVMLHLQDALWALKHEPRHQRVLVGLLASMPLFKLEDLYVGKRDLKEAQQGCVRWVGSLGAGWVSSCICGRAFKHLSHQQCPLAGS
jgi:hypothetical protein